MKRTRSNQEWKQDLGNKGPVREAALVDLREIVAKGLPYALSHWLSSTDPHFEALVEESTQETLLKVLSSLHQFEGRSKFTTWVFKIAVRVAISELRRKRWKDTSLDDLLTGENALERVGLMADVAPGPENVVEQSDILSRLERILSESLTEKQRNAIIAIRIHDIPIEEVARKMGMTRNALYKLLHDARLNVKRRMAEQGITTEEALAVFKNQ